MSWDDFAKDVRKTLDTVQARTDSPIQKRIDSDAITREQISGLEEYIRSGDPVALMADPDNPTWLQKRLGEEAIQRRSTMKSLDLEEDL